MQKQILSPGTLLIGGVSAKGKERFYEKMGFDIIPNGIKKMIEIK
jgi:hypothetical protein